jgi:TolA-binding protein
MGLYFRLSAALAALLVTVSPLRAEGDNLEKSMAEMRDRLAKVEARLNALEKQQGDVDARRAAFRARMAADAKKYKPEQLKEAEELYQTMNKDWRSEGGKAALEKLISKYPDINRTGCAYLYLGQVSKGEEKEKYLRTAIDKHGDCMYGDGVVVGAYARYLLGLHLQSAGKTEEGKALLDEVKAQYPTAVDHGGRSLVTQIENAQ